MDLSHLNQRKAAEVLFPVYLCHPATRERLDDDNDTSPTIWVRGAASKVVDKKLAEIAKQKKTHRKEDEARSMSATVQKLLVDSAMVYVEKWENIELDGVPVETEKQLREVLDMTVVDMEHEEDDDGNKIYLQDGKTPKYRIANYPFAKQIVDAAEEGDNFLGESTPS